MEFGNGRSLFVFSRDGTLYSFSGGRTQQRDGKTFILIVDTVRIAAQTTPERDLTDMEGECIVQTEANGKRFAAIECDAHRRGQSARYKFILDRIANFERKTSR